MTATATAPITHGDAAVELDAATVYAQIMAADAWTLARVGATARYYSATHVQFDVSGGQGRPRRRVLIILTAADTYTVEIGRTHRRTFEWISDQVVEGVYAEQLAQVIESIYAKAYGF